MAITINWATKVINVPQADLTFISGTLYELDTESTFRSQVIALMAGDEGMPFVDPIDHTGEKTLAGVTYARFIEVINGYTVTFEDGSYRVRLTGSNNNISDVVNLNQVQVITQNSTGLVSAISPSNLLTVSKFIALK